MGINNQFNDVVAQAYLDTAKEGKVEAADVSHKLVAS